MAQAQPAGIIPASSSSIIGQQRAGEFADRGPFGLRKNRFTALQLKRYAVLELPHHLQPLLPGDSMAENDWHHRIAVELIRYWILLEECCPLAHASMLPAPDVLGLWRCLAHLGIYERFRNTHNLCLRTIPSRLICNRPVEAGILSNWVAACGELIKYFHPADPKHPDNFYSGFDAEIWSANACYKPM